MQSRARFTLALGLMLAVAVTAAASSCSSSNNGPNLSANCSINSDCNSPLICAFARCHEACTESRDCMSGERCVQAGKSGVCQLASESTCGAGGTCQTGQVCVTTDNQCRGQCTAAGGCTMGDYCLLSGATSACYSASNPSDQPALMAAGILGPDGAVLSDASTVVVDAAGGDSPAPPGDDSGDATIAPEPCDAATLADGGCDYCPPKACASGTCISGNHDYSCKCNAGYAGTGTKACTLANGCLGNDPCPPAYPCEPVASSGTACLGQYLVTSVPDQAAMSGGSTQPPSYSNNGDGTVTDNVTALMWQLNVPTTASCATAPTDAGADATAPNECTVAEAHAYCASLTLGGHNDWRLPDLIELESILQCTSPAAPYIANAFLPTPPISFWTASALTSTAGYNWYVDFGAGAYGCGDITWAGATGRRGSVACAARGQRRPPLRSTTRSKQVPSTPAWETQAAPAIR